MNNTRTLLMGLFLSVVLVAPSAWAQGMGDDPMADDPMADDGMGDDSVGETDYSDSSETTVTASASSSSADSSDTSTSAAGSDFEQTVGSWGFQVTQVFPSVGISAAAAPALGVRKWTSDSSGWEAGLAFRVARTGGVDATDLLIGANFAYLIALATFDHMNVFFAPGASFFVGAPEVGDTQWFLTASGAIGTEIRLGMIGLPRIGITTRLSAGITFGDTTGDVDILFGTFGQENGGLDGLWEGTVGFIFYM